MLRAIQSRQRHNMLLNEQLISSCTQRLLQIQKQIQIQGRELQYKRKQENIRLQQQFVSSVVMKQQAQKRLLQQQNLLIEYLKQQLYELTVSSNTYNLLLKNINQLQHGYLQLNERKMQDEQNYEQQIINTKREYQQLLQLLLQVTNQSTVKYELVLKLRERNQITSLLLKEKTILYEQLLRRHQLQSLNNNKRKQTHQQLNKTIQKSQQQNNSLQQSLQSQTHELQNNKNRLNELQQQIKLYQQSTNKLKHIHEAALNDNTVLKQQLKQKIQLMKSKQSLLEQINTQKQHLSKQKNIQNSKVNQMIKENDNMKVKLNELATSTQQLIQQLTQIGIQQQIADRQITKLNLSIQKLNQLKANTIRYIHQKQQQLQKQSYFIQQYININNELIQQIEILIQEDQKKQTINKGFITNSFIGNKNRGSQQLLINKLRNLLIVAKQQLKTIQLAHLNILRQVQQFQINR